MASDHDIQNREHRYYGNDKGSKRTSPPELNTIIVEDGDYTYIAQAIPGTLESEAAWAVRRIDESVSGTTKIIWAGTGEFDQVATDLPGLFT